MFRRVLIANRGLIQANCVRAVKELGATAVTIFEEGDRDSAGVRNADEAYELRVGDPRLRPYLDIDQIVALAEKLKVDAVHPGYGFLAQSAAFARALARSGIMVIAPRAEGLHNLSDKHKVKEAVARAGFPVIEGSPAFSAADRLEAAAAQAGYPLMLKAVHGYGGIGMRVVHEPRHLEGAFRQAQAACAKFLLNSPEVFAERFLPEVRHIEFPVLRDDDGRTVVFPEMECSLQRRFQKLLVETPVADLDPDLRACLQSEIRVLCQRLDIFGFACFEFLLTGGQAVFLEINGYIQPSHTATTLLTGVDLLKEQIRLFSGEPLGCGAEAPAADRHVIGSYIYAEDPDNNFEPSPGRIERLYLPFGEEVFLQTSIFSGATVSPFYDPMIAKLLVRGRSRAEAILKLRIALDEFFVEGVKTNIPLMRGVLHAPAFQEGRVTPSFLGSAAVRRRLVESLKSPRDYEIAALVAALALHRDGDTLLKRIEAGRVESSLLGAAARWLRPRKRARPL